MPLPFEYEEYIHQHQTTISAASASLVATSIGFPLDSIKSRLQASKYNGVADCARKIYKHEGLQGFFRGLTMPLLTITLVRTISFTIYETTKRRLANPASKAFNPDSLQGKATLGFFGGAASGLLLSVGTCAFELVKVRSQLEYLISKQRGIPYQPHGTFSGGALIYKENGLRGLYFGFWLHTLRDTLGTSLYFTSYDSLRYLLDTPRFSGVQSGLAPFLCGSTCGILSWFLVYPIDLVKTRIQRDALSGVKDREGAITVFNRLRQKGLTRLYRGLGVSAGRSALTHGTLWLLLGSVAIEAVYVYHIASINEVPFVPTTTSISKAGKLDYLRSYVSSAAQAVLAKGNSVPGLPRFNLGERRHEYDGHSIWTLYDGKESGGDNVSIFVFDVASPISSGNRDRRPLLPLARNALRKLRSLRHPQILSFRDGVDQDNAVYIVTDRVTSLTARIGTEGQEPGQGDDWKVWGLSQIVTALSFINSSGASTHGHLRPSSIFINSMGDWKLGGFEVLSTMKDSSPVLYTYGGLLPDSARFSSPEVRKTGWDCLKDLDPSSLDAYQLHLLIHILFNGPLPSSFITDPSPSLPTTRGKIPAAIFPSWRRLGNANPRARLKVEHFLEVGMGSEGGGGQQGAGFFSSNRLVRLAQGFDVGGFALASEGERAVLIRMVKDNTDGIPPEFVNHRILPSVIKAFEFGPGGPGLLPLVLSLGDNLPPAEYSTSIVQTIIRMFATPDRAMRMALLEGLPQYVEKLDQKTVSDKIWPNLVTGFTDVVPIIRESTVKSVLLLAPKLTDRLLNNDLLRYLAKTQTDTEAGIRTNTCILLGRLCKYLQPATARKVLVPAFARALRDPFVHARIAGLMSLMATVEVYEKEDLAARVIPSMSICLVDKEKNVRQQAFKAIDMFVKRTESLTANMPDTVLPPEDASSTASGNVAVAGSRGGPSGVAESAGGAAVALAGWAFTSLSSRLGNSDLATPMLERKNSSQSVNGASGNAAPASVGIQSGSKPSSTSDLRSSVSDLRSSSQPNLGRVAATRNANLPGGFGASGSARSSLSIPDFGGDEDTGGDWGGDLMDVQADEGDFDDFESAQPAPPPVPAHAQPVVHPRFTITKTAASPKKKPVSSLGASKGMKLGGSTVSSGSSLGKSTNGSSSLGMNSVLKAIEAEEGPGDWSFDASMAGDDSQAAVNTADLDEATVAWGEDSEMRPRPETPSTPGRTTAASNGAESGTGSPAAASASTSTATSVGKEKLAQMKEERKARLAAAKAKKEAAATAGKK